MNMTTIIDPFIEECLIVLQEECAEVVQAISKIRRFGPNSFNPNDENKTTNLALLSQEIGDVLAMIDYLVEEGLITEHDLRNAKIKKRIKFSQYRTNHPKRKPINDYQH